LDTWDPVRNFQGHFATAKGLFINIIKICKIKLNRVSVHVEVAGCLKTWICVYCFDIKIFLLYMSYFSNSSFVIASLAS
jgi:hypothetical protein